MDTLNEGLDHFMDSEYQLRQIKRFLRGKYRIRIDSFCIYQWIDRCHFHGWWDLGVKLGVYLPPKSLDEQYHKRLEYILSVCKVQSIQQKRVPQKGEKAAKISDRTILLRKFWEGLLEASKKKTSLFGNKHPRNYIWIAAGSGKRGIIFVYVVRQHETQVELYIDRGKNGGVENKSIFKRLMESKDEIEKRFGSILEWQELEEKRACRIRKRFFEGGYYDEEKRWPDIYEPMTEAMVKFEKAFRPHIMSLKI